MNISQTYLQQQQKLHRNPNYGKASVSYAPLVTELMIKTGLREIADYGSGKCRLYQELSKNFKQLTYFPYDPSFPEYGDAKAADLVTCIDVLEHIEYEFIDTVLNELALITKKIGFLSIHTGPAKKILEDGRNAHLIQESTNWWLEKLLSRFDIVQLTPVKKGFWVIVCHRNFMQREKLLVKKTKYSALRQVARCLGVKSR